MHHQEINLPGNVYPLSRAGNVAFLSHVWSAHNPSDTGWLSAPMKRYGFLSGWSKIIFRVALRALVPIKLGTGLGPFWASDIAKETSTTKITEGLPSPSSHRQNGWPSTTLRACKDTVHRVSSQSSLVKIVGACAEFPLQKLIDSDPYVYPPLSLLCIIEETLRAAFLVTLSVLSNMPGLPITPRALLLQLRGLACYSYGSG